MNPVVYRLGSTEIHAFTGWLIVGLACGLAVLLGSAYYRQQRLMPWLDAGLGAIVGGVIGARLVHVWLNWAYFVAHTDQIAVLSTGGVDWHGAVMGGLAGACLIALARRLPILVVFDALALAFPIGALTSWQACASANCGYGLEVHTLADYPSWLAVESPDVYGITAPRLNLPPIGLALAGLVLLVMAILAVLGKLHGTRLWLGIALFGLGMAVIDMFRAEYVPMWFGRRADHILDLALALAAILCFTATFIIAHRFGTALSRRIVST